MLGICYYPEQWPEAWWSEDARAMRTMGITHVRIGEFAWSRIEPEPGRLDWGWLDRALDVLGQAGLRVVLGTPTATPPRWLVLRHPGILPVDADGRVRGFGSRRHTSFSSPDWQRESRRIVELLAERYGEHPAIVGWQVDNEFGCHNTVLSYGPHDVAAFRDWLRARYGEVATLNARWGNVFWSMEAGSFDEIDAPVGAVTETNPIARLDYRRFSSDQVAAYGAMQAEILRARSPGRFVTHNFMGFFAEFDHWKVGRDYDVVSWDSYPLGFLERFSFEDAERARWAETSLPDIAPFHHDLYRGVGRGRWWVMEQQPGPVNWARHNPVPKPGMVRLWSWEALAHGAEVVSYFRWRQAPFAQEQMHAGLQRPDRSLSAGGGEVGTVGRELHDLLMSLGTEALPDSQRATVALVLDYESLWMAQIQPQGADFDALLLHYRWYEAVRCLGIDVDILPPGAPLDSYAAILVPSLMTITPDAIQAFATTEAVLLFGPRSGSKTTDFAIPETLPPGPLQSLLPARVTQVASLPYGLRYRVAGEGVQGQAERWREWLEPRDGAACIARYDDGNPAIIRHGRVLYCGAWADEPLLSALVRHVLRDLAGLPVVELPVGVRLRRRDSLCFAFNYGDEPWAISGSPALLFGTDPLAPQEVACWRIS